MARSISVRPGRVAVGGAINTDLVATTERYPETGETVTGTGFSMFGGGKGGNQAVAVARSGAPVVMVGGVGDDAFGAARLDDLETDGVGTRAVQRISGVSSGVALIEVEAGGDNRILYVPGATLHVDADRAVAELGEEPIAVLLLTLELAPAVMDRLITRAGDDDALIVVNATPEPERAAALFDRVDVLIVNETEALALSGSPVDPSRDWSEVAVRLRERGAGAVLITLGGDGALWLDDDGPQMVAAPAVTVVDTTGAGDTVCGAFVAALARGAAVRDAVRIGVTAGSLACTVAGAQPSIPTRAAIDRMMGTDAAGSGNRPR